MSVEAKFLQPRNKSLAPVAVTYIAGFSIQDQERFSSDTPPAPAGKANA